LKLKNQDWIQVLSFAKNNYVVTTPRGNERCKASKRLGLISALQTPIVQVAGNLLKNEVLFSPSLNPARMATAQKNNLIWGTVRCDDAYVSRGEILIYEGKGAQDGYQEIQEGRLYEKIQETKLADDKLDFYGSSLEDIISTEPLLYITVGHVVKDEKNKYDFLQVHSERGTEMFTLGQENIKWKKNVFKSEEAYELRDDLNRAYIIKSDNNFGLLFYDHTVNKFFQIKSSVVWSKEKTGEMKNSWLEQSINKIESIKIKENNLLHITRFDGIEIKVKIKYINSRTMVGNQTLESYEEEEQALISTLQIKPHENNINEFKIIDYISLIKQQNNGFKINYKNNDLNIDESFDISAQELSNEEDLQWPYDNRNITYYLRSIDENSCHIVIETHKEYFNFIFPKQKLFDEFNKTIEKKEEAIKAFPYTYSQYLKQSTSIYDKNHETKELVKKEQKREDLKQSIQKNWIQENKKKEEAEWAKRKRWTKGILGVSAVAVLFLWSWWRNNKTTKKQ